MGKAKIEETKTSQEETLTPQELLNEIKALKEQLNQLKKGKEKKKPTEKKQVWVFELTEIARTKVAYKQGGVPETKHYKRKFYPSRNELAGQISMFATNQYILKCVSGEKSKEIQSLIDELVNSKTSKHNQNSIEAKLVEIFKVK